MFDKIGDRFKENYENRTRISLPRRTYSVIRLDGRSFHSFTKKCDRPFDTDLMSLMDYTSMKLCEGIQGVKLAYVQSDEISLLLTDFDEISTCAWFDGNIQKITSISASMATANFNKELLKTLSSCELSSQMRNMEKFLDKDGEPYTALFDSRVFTIADSNEVENYFIWRQLDASRNSVQMAAQALYSHKELHGKNTSELQDLIFEKGINWNDYPSRCKRGTVILKELYDKDGVTRSRWVAVDTPIFTKDRYLLRSLIPLIPSWEN